MRKLPSPGTGGASAGGLCSGDALSEVVIIVPNA